MNTVFHPTRSTKMVLYVLLALMIAAGVFIAPYTEPYQEWVFEGKAKVREGGVQTEVVSASPLRPVRIEAAAPGSFTPQTRLGFDVGDQWEPAIAADRFGHVYMLYPQYGGVPGCADCL